MLLLAAEEILFAIVSGRARKKSLEVALAGRSAGRSRSDFVELEVLHLAVLMKLLRMRVSQ